MARRMSTRPDYDIDRLLWLNLGFLFIVVLTPFPTELIGQYRSSPTANLFSNLNATIIGLLNVVIWAYARSGDLVGPQIPSPALRIFTWRAAVLPIVLGLAAVLRFVSLPAAVASWSLLLLSRPLVRALLGPLPAREEASEGSLAIWQPTAALFVWFLPLLVIRLYQHQRLAVEAEVTVA